MFFMIDEFLPSIALIKTFCPLTRGKEEKIYFSGFKSGGMFRKAADAEEVIFNNQFFQVSVEN